MNKNLKLCIIGNLLIQLGLYSALICIGYDNATLVFVIAQRLIPVGALITVVGLLKKYE